MDRGHDEMMMMEMCSLLTAENFHVKYDFQSIQLINFNQWLFHQPKNNIAVHCWGS